jgi:mono/diheme cytochrome c family protein
MKPLRSPSSFPARLRVPGALVLAGALALGWAWCGVPMEPIQNPFAGDEWVLPVVQPSLRPGDGARLVTTQCSLCHSLDYIATQPALTRAQWTAGIEKMRTRFGAPIQTNQVSALVEYLTRNYGKP